MTFRLLKIAIKLIPFFNRIAPSRLKNLLTNTVSAYTITIGNYQKQL